MRMKLSLSEMQSLEYALSGLLLNFIPDSYYHKLLIAIIQKLYIKIAKALVEHQRDYNITIDEITALAFSELFDHYPFQPTEHSFNLMLKLSNNIKQQFA